MKNILPLQVLLVTGGRMGSHNTQNVQYDSTELLNLHQSNSWRYAASLPNPRYGLRTGLFFNKVYVFGGKFHSADKILSYNEATDEWQEEGGMMVNRRWHEVLVIENVPCPGPDPSTGLWQKLLSLVSPSRS